MKIYIINQTLQDIMRNLSYIRYDHDLLDHIQVHLNRMHSSIYALKDDVNSLYKYLHLLTTQHLTPVTIPPNLLQGILQHIQDEIRSNARLKLAEDPEMNLWAFYNIIKVTPIVMEDMLMLILTVPLIDQPLEMNLYEIHNLPMLHPELKVQAMYELKGSYLATLMEGMYVALPDATDIKLCMMTQGHLCMFDKALYPVDHVNWYVYALFINDLECIKTNCILKTTPQTSNLAHSLDGYL